MPHQKSALLTPSALERQRALGSYYTAHNAAYRIASWALRDFREAVILEPSFGSGVFLQALNLVAQDQGTDLTLTGVDIDQAAHAAIRAAGLTAPRIVHQDFLDLAPYPVDVVIGNPPYVRLRNLPIDQATKARSLSSKILGADMEADGSLWMPFVLHALSFLKTHGRLALVLPHEATYVRYALPLWKHLASAFGDLQIVRIRERLFPDLLQSVVVLLANDFGGSTRHVKFSAYETVAQFIAQDKATIEADIPIAEIISSARPFVRALIGPAANELLLSHQSSLFPVSQSVKFHIGYVSGHKGFFHPSKDEQAKFGIQPKNLRPALASARNLKGVGLYTSRLPSAAKSDLFYPLSLGSGEEDYLAAGESLGVSKGYKCSHREPWYLVPDVATPDVILSVFAERPTLLINDGSLLASNSHLCGFLQAGVTPTQLASVWYTSLTLLQTELNIHALGGGVMVFVPKEAGRILIPDPHEISTVHLNDVDSALKSPTPEDAFLCGNRPVLENHLGFTVQEIVILQTAIEQLRRWRLST